MKLSQLAAQTYTVRDHLHDSSAFARSIERLKSIGYPAVELIPSETVSDAEIVGICRNAGMRIAAAHVTGQLVIQRPAEVIAKMATLGADIVVYGFPAGVDMSSRADVERLADKLNGSAATLHEAGVVLAYHNHALEFCRSGEELAIDVLRAGAPGLSFELDSYWLQYAGINPEQWIQKLGDRLVSFQLKDFGVSPRHGEPPFMTEIGNGNLDFRAIIPAAEAAGCRWFIVEQDVTPGDPFASLEQSFRYLQKELVAS
jgi:sugar phosphate isomerase/epimerase